MEVQTIIPHGFCEGVMNAIRIAKRARKEHPGVTIHVLGSLVHNEEVEQELEKDHFVFHSEREKPLEDSLASIPPGSVLVFAAHGHDHALDAIAESKGMIIYDATCRFVKQNAAIITMELATGHEVIYIGKKGHAECVGALSIDKNKVHLCDPSELKQDNSWRHLSEKQPAVIFQTTMDWDDMEMAKKAIIELYPEALFANERCFSTKRRQEAIRQAEPDTDLYIILGSSTSNNTNKLFDIARKYYPNASVLRLLNLEALRKADIHGKRKAALASGASTSDVTYQAALTYLKNQ